MCDDYHDDRHSITIANRHPSLTFRATEFRHGPVAPAIGKNGQVMDLNNTIKKKKCFGMFWEKSSKCHTKAGYQK